MGESHKQKEEEMKKTMITIGLIFCAAIAAYAQDAATPDVQTTDAGW